jgi:hypothetical protein
LQEEFATEPGVPGVLSLPAGTAFRHFHCTTGATNEVARLKVETYTCNADGTGETLRRTDESGLISGTVNTEYGFDVSDANAYAMTITQRIVFKLYAARVSGPATCNLTIYFNGTTNVSFITTTIPVPIPYEPSTTLLLMGG